ncbi:MAG TPA: hypothetical protein VE326_06985 [Candidatus Binatia bacterium]|nr:hypothetical protein [Candidatus Binatia bacterium]
MTDLPARSFALPDLRVVPVDCLVPHERHDEHRMGPLTARLRSEAVLRNPPIVTPASASGEERYVVLDGANRSEAARAIGLPHFAVQVVPYEEPDVRLLTWNHALAGADAGSLFQLLSSVPGIACSRESQAHARALLARREIIAYAASTGGAIALSAPGDFTEQNRALNRVVEAYREKTRVYRVGSDSVEAALERIPDAEAIVVFPRYAPAEVLELAATGERVPAGITRHLVRWRALRVNLPLDLLADRETSREEKQAWLRSWMRERVEQGHVRFYEESTVLFDE